ncbi:MAG: nitrate reductase cytochrome c-type subunit [Alphaproteobacteria bacterium]
MTKRHSLTSLLAAGLSILALAVASAASAQSVTPETTGLRGTASLGDTAEAPRIAQTEETDRRQARNYPEQPPVIPHRIDEYQLDKNANQCLSCHARARVSESGAPMISITHFMDRDGQFLAAVSPRRYFCNQCHVVQTRVPVPVRNTFVDIDSLLAVEAANSGN